jgi:hypothetical protein
MTYRYDITESSPTSFYCSFEVHGTASLNGVLGNTCEHLAALGEAQVAEDLLTLAVDLDQICLLVQVHDRMLGPRHRARVQIGVACGLGLRV